MIMDAQATLHLGRIDRTLRTSAVGALLLIAAWLLRDILLLAFAAVLLACILRGASHQLHRKIGFGPGWCLLIVLSVLVLAIGALLWWRGPAMVHEAGQMADQLTTQVRRLWAELQHSTWGAQIADRLRCGSGLAGIGMGGYLSGISSSVLGAGASLIIVVAAGLFLAISPQVYVRGSLHLFPESWRPRGREVMVGVGTTLQIWFLG